MQKELQLDNLKPAEKAKLNNQLLVLEKQHQNDIAQIQRQAQAWATQVRSEAMPPNNATGLTAEERGRLLAWVAAGARLD